MSWLEGFSACFLLLTGLYLSAFFSGTETGFYRISLPRLSIDAQAGDRVAQRLMWFVRHPAYFVATTLVGKNLSDYVITYAISLFVILTLGHLSVAVDVGLTVLLSPVVFLFCDLVPKNLYYRAPHFLLRRDSVLFSVFYWLLLPASWPLVGLTKVIEWFAPDPEQRTELMLGRNRLVQLMRQGRREGLLTDVQSRLANGVLQIAPQAATASMTPAGRVLGLTEGATSPQILQYAQRFATPVVALRRNGTSVDWFGYVRIVDVALNKKPLSSLVRRMPVISPSASKLDALQMLQSEGESFGVVKDGEQVLGVVSSRGLCEQLFRPVNVHL